MSRIEGGGRRRSEKEAGATWQRQKSGRRCLRRRPRGEGRQERREGGRKKGEFRYILLIHIA